MAYAVDTCLGRLLETFRLKFERGDLRLKLLGEHATGRKAAWCVLEQAGKP